MMKNRDEIFRRFENYRKVVMKHLKNLKEKIPMWKIGDLLVGFTILVSGAYVAWMGIAGLRELWTLYASFLPITLPEDVGQRILNSLPVIVTLFINTVASIAAVLMGAAWVLSGIAEVFAAGKKSPDPVDFQQPELVAESLGTAQAQHWKVSSLLGRLAGRFFPTARLLSPVSYRVLGDIRSSCLRILIVGLLLYGAIAALHMIPGLLKRYVHIDIVLAVPPGRPLWVLLGFLLFVYFLISLSLIPIKRPQFLRTSEYVPVRGTGDPQTFFALVEEGCRLLNTAGTPYRQPIRLEVEDNPEKRASLIETSAEPLNSVARPAAYCCLPLIFLFLVNGFSRLINFRQSVDFMPWAEFLTKHLPSYLMQAGFAVALIIAALHLAERARRLFRIRRYRSGIVFLQVPAEQNTEQVSNYSPDSVRSSKGRNETRWKSADSTNRYFADWVMSSRQSKRFGVQVFWAQAISESERPDAPRFLVDLRRSTTLDEAMHHIIRIPFHVSFEPDDREPDSSPEDEPGRLRG